MNTQERQQLTAFLQQLSEAQAIQKDSEADALIRASCTRQSDATYLLVQRAMLLEQALRNSQDEITRLQGQVDQARALAADGSAGFIDANSWGNSPAAGSALSSRPLPVAPPTAPAAIPAASAWGSGMLGTIATTAAGVVAGGFLFQGIEHLIGSRASTIGARHDSSSQANSPAIDQALDVGPDGDTAASGVFDTSSVDDFIANDTDSDV